MKDIYIDCALPPLFKSKQRQVYNLSSPPNPQSTATINTLADTGTTDFLVRSTDVPAHLVPCGPTITISLPNKSRITSLGSILIPIPHSDVVITAHVIHPSKLTHNLSSVSQLCLQGCSAIFKSNSVQVFDRHGTVILAGAKNFYNLLWTLPLPICLRPHLPTWLFTTSTTQNSCSLSMPHLGVRPCLLSIVPFGKDS